jgi:precorrin-2 dehydrogenase/sirohydrochlorin ferrochelatase
MLHSVACDAAASEFIVPSVVRRGALQIAVTTGGGAPSVAREVRRGIAAAYGPEWAEYTRLVTELRILAIERTGLPDADLAPLFAALEESGLRARLAAGEKVTAEALYEQHEGVLTGSSPEGAAG